MRCVPPDCMGPSQGKHVRPLAKRRALVSRTHHLVLNAPSLSLSPIHKQKAEVKEEGDAVDPALAPSTAQASAHVLDTYTNRELKHLERERSGEVQAHYVINDGSPLSGRLLIGLKNVFSKCLPNMPKEYITRLVFDRRHR